MPRPMAGNGSRKKATSAPSPRAKLDKLIIGEQRTSGLGQRLRACKQSSRRVGTAPSHACSHGNALVDHHPAAETPAGVTLQRSQRLSRQVVLPGRGHAFDVEVAVACAPFVSLESELQLVVDIHRDEDREYLVIARLVLGTHQETQVDLGRGSLRDTHHRVLLLVDRKLRQPAPFIMRRRTTNRKPTPPTYTGAGGGGRHWRLMR